MGQTHRKSDTFGDKKRQRDRKKILKRLKKQKRRKFKQPDEQTDNQWIGMPESDFH